jgi:AraC-like DNA-binding protein
MIAKSVANEQKDTQYLLWGVMENVISGYSMIVPPQDKFLMLYIHSGTGEIKQGENCWRVMCGNLVFLRFGLTYLIRSVGEDLSFTSILASGVCRDLPFMSDTQCGSETERQLGELCQICSASVPGLTVPQFDSFLFSLKSAAHQKQPKKHRCAVYIETLKQVLDSRFSETLHLDQFAEELHLNKYKLIKDFKKNYGLPPVEYLINRRIQEACRLLRETDASVTEVGSRVGMDNTPYFIRTFKKKIGCTPLVFRKSMQHLRADAK